MIIGDGRAASSGGLMGLASGMISKLTDKYVLSLSRREEGNLSVKQDTSSCCTNKEAPRPIDRQRDKESHPVSWNCAISGRRPINQIYWFSKQIFSDHNASKTK